MEQEYLRAKKKYFFLKKKYLCSLPYREYLQTEHWKEVRKLILQRDEFECLVCGVRYNLNIHHNYYEHRGEEEFFLDDLITVCRKCHERIHNASR